MSATSLVANLARIEATGLVCVRGERRVFVGLDLAVEQGMLLTLEGPNGAGKSSALRILAGLLPPVAGTVAFHAQAGVITDNEERGRFVAWLGHADGIKAQLSVAENARLFAALFGGELDASAALRRVRLGSVADIPAHYLSAGQRRRLGLARLLLSGRPLWLLDEPFSALDSNGRTLVADLVAQHLAGGGIAIAATHEPLGLTGTRVMLGAIL